MPASRTCCTGRNGSKVCASPTSQQLPWPVCLDRCNTLRHLSSCYIPAAREGITKQNLCNDLQLPQPVSHERCNTLPHPRSFMCADTKGSTKHISHNHVLSGVTRCMQDLPDASWPRPKPPRWPFSGGLSDYMRAVGPGVYVGAGWRAPRPEKRDVGRRFLTFLLVRCPQ